MKPTRALRKISLLKNKLRVIQGGQGAGKTYAISSILINHVASKPHKKVLIASLELTKMRDTVLQDCISIIRHFGIPCTITGAVSGRPMIYFPNGSFIRFLGLDQEDVGKGFHNWDALFINEANKIKTWETVRQLLTRFRVSFIDFNPDIAFWAHEHLINRTDCDFIKLTFLDNEYLDQSEVDEVLRYHLLGYGVPFDPEQTELLSPISEYWANKWRVYGLGEVGILEGAVYQNYEIIKELPSEAKILGGGIDFGWVHPQAAIAAYEWNGRRVYDEVDYGSMRGMKLMAESIKLANLQREVWYCDNAQPQMIYELYELGIDAVACDGKTGLINAAIDKMQRETFYITERSLNIINEIRAYKWDEVRSGAPTGKPVKIGDDAMNAIQYFEGTEGKYTGKYR
jgi:phage terminase large subunit